MKKQTSQKEQEALSHKIEVANEVIRQFDWLQPGTYTAGDIHRLMVNRYGKVYLRNKIAQDKRCMYPFTTPFKGEPKTHTVVNDNGYYTYSDYHVFREIMRSESAMRRTGKKSHLWEVPVKGVYHTSYFAEFPPKSYMRKVASISKECFSGSILTFSTSESRIAAEYRGFSMYLKCQVESNTSIDAMKVDFCPEQIRRVYGKCRMEVYVDAETNTLITVMTNPDGYKISMPTTLVEPKKESLEYSVSNQ